MKMTPKMIKKIKQYSSVLGAVVLALVMMAVPSFAEEPELDYSECYASSFPDSLASPVNAARVESLYSGLVGTTIYAFSNSSSFNSSTGVLNYVFDANYTNQSDTVYLFFSSGTTVTGSSGSLVTKDDLPVSNSGNVTFHYYDANRYVPLTDIPDDVVIWRASINNGTGYTASLSLTVIPPVPPVPTQSETVLDLGKTLLTTTLNYGNTLITWVCANEIVMVFLALYVLIALCSIVFKFLPGVR